MKHLILLFGFSILSICVAYSQPASGTIYYTDGSTQRFHTMWTIAGRFYDNSTTLGTKEKMRVFYNNSYREIPLKDINKITVVDYSINSKKLVDVKLKIEMKSGISFTDEFKELWDLRHIELKDELSKEISTTLIYFIKQNKDNVELNIKSVIFD